LKEVECWKYWFSTKTPSTTRSTNSD